MSLLRTVIDTAITVIGRLKRSRKVNAARYVDNGQVKINLGCGLSVARGWLNIDGSVNALFASSPGWMHKILYNLSGSREYYTLEEYGDILGGHRFLYHDLSLSLPLPEKSVDYIYSSHFFEHIFKDDASRLLGECYRALKPGGIIRISVPDLAYAVALYGKGKTIEMLDDYFFVSGKGSYLARHKYMYDFDLLKRVLEEAGFADVTRCSYRQGKTPDISTLDVYPEVSLFVEATRA